jgi:phage N-6-adenine-methyltransferase
VNHRAEGSGDNEWFTPVDYIAAAREVMGEIDLDPATHSIAQQTVQAVNHFTRADDGLAQPWHGRVWLNPPYAQPFIAQFIEKLVTEVTDRRVEQAILLTHNYTDTGWFHHAEGAADLLCFTRGRIKFVDIDGDDCAPTQGQAFFYYGAEIGRFREIFSQFGFVR